MTKLKELCEILNISINLTYHTNDTKRHKHFNKECKEIFLIGMLENHYFIIEDVDFTNYSISNYFAINTINNWNLITRKLKDQYIKNDKRKYDSYKLIKCLLKNKETHLELITLTNDLLSTFYDKTSTIINDLSYDEKKCVKEIKKPEIKDDGNDIVFFDFETYNNKITRKVIPYLCCSCDMEGNTKTYYGENSGEQLLKGLSRNTTLVAHNSSFDINFIIKYFTTIKTIMKKGKNTLDCQAKYYNLKIKIKDSYGLISKPLRAFGKCFNLEQGKEVMPYNIYDDYYTNIEKYPNKQYPIRKALKELKTQGEQEMFVENIKKWGLQRGEFNFDPEQYSKYYCIIDCQVLMKGYYSFRKSCLELNENLDINNILTAASFADKYLILNGCYDDVVQLAGIPREFHQRCVVGGRTMCNNNKKYILKNVKMSDFDAVSLYPSAMRRCKGFLKGIPKVLESNQLNINFLNSIDGYFVKILIKKVGIKREFSLMSKMVDMVRYFNNEMEGEELYVDKYSLEDLIEFQKVEFDVLQGYYYNEGRNTTIREVIHKLFTERLIKKREKNPIQEVYKLIMNSGYGKSIMKAVETELIIKRDIETTTKRYGKGNELYNYIGFNYNKIHSFEPIHGSTCNIIKVFKPIIEHFSRPQVGTEILSMSKRIMNELMCLAEDNKLKIYYQDTDSMHVGCDDIPILSELYKVKYNRELIGCGMGQFHTDFNHHTAVNNDEVYARNTIILGKKMYIDELVGKDKYNKVVVDYHIRMKGVSNDAILHKCKELKINPLQLYEKLYNNEVIEFDLLCNGTKPCFKFNSNFSVMASEKFSRKVKCFYEEV